MKGRHRQSAFFSLRALIITLICSASILSGTLLAFFHADTRNDVHRTLTFAERVAYQRAIEEVYWRHRIWPKERSDSKPTLDGVMSQAQLENKVADYLRKSQELQDKWQQPITSEQLQAEMDRMAKHTSQPEVLRELFEALGNDPFVIAECLARPVLAERVAEKSLGQDKPPMLDVTANDQARSIGGVAVADNAAYSLPRGSDGDSPCTDDTWTATSTMSAPFQRYYHTAVWTGSEMIIWGGLQYYYTVNTGGKYNPATDSWTYTSTTNAPSERCLHTAVWTGTEMIIWGGGGVLFGDYLNTGGRYNPMADSWRFTTTANAPSARYFHTPVWSGSEMIVWGGYNGSQLNTGGRYNANTDSWTATGMTNAPSARQEHTAVWTGNEMIVWGGYLFDGSSHFLNTGGKYDPALDSWTSTSTRNAPTGRRYQTAVWSGSEMIVWGGQDINFMPFNTGGRYNPVTDLWIPTSTNNAPTPRQSHTAVWTGDEMVVWGGYPYFNYSEPDRSYSINSAGPTPTGTPSPPPFTPTPTPTPDPTPTIPGTGGRYDPVSDSWTASSTSNAAGVRQLHTAVWTGSEMIVWGGADPGDFVNTGGRYCAQGVPAPTPTLTPTPTVTATPTATPCTGRCNPTPRPHPTPAPRL